MPLLCVQWMVHMNLSLYVPEDAAGDISVAEVVAAFLDHLQRRHDAGDYSADALANARRELERFAAAHDRPVRDCAQADLTRWLAANPQWVSAHTKSNVCTILVACFAWAADEEAGALIDRCPYKRPKILKGLPYEPRRPADHHEYVMLMRKGSRELRRALFFLRRTGARTKEMRELRWENVILDGDTPHIRLEQHKTRRKTGTCRKIGLDPATAAWFRAIRRSALDSVGLVFLNTRGGGWDRHTFARHLRRTAQRIGLDAGVERRVSAYCLRHTYACDGIEAGATTREIADQLGHTSEAMVSKVYGCHTRDREKHLSRVAGFVVTRRRRD